MIIWNSFDTVVPINKWILAWNIEKNYFERICCLENGSTLTDIRIIEGERTKYWSAWTNINNPGE